MESTHICYKAHSVNILTNNGHSVLWGGGGGTYGTYELTVGKKAGMLIVTSVGTYCYRRDLQD
jgi:hypothetical protein